VSSTGRTRSRAPAGLFVSSSARQRRTLFRRSRNARRGGLSRVLRFVGLLLIIAGITVLAWTVTVYLWQDPVTAVIAKSSQRALAQQFEARTASPTYATPASRRIALPKIASRYQRAVSRGDSVGRLSIPKLDQDLFVVWGTDSGSLRKGPGIDPRTSMPGRGQLVYVAGHRTTYGAPFADIDDLVTGDVVELEVPYATFTYRVTGRRIVPATYIQALESRGREEIALQACWPRFFATHRIIVYARPIDVDRTRRATQSASEAAPRRDRLDRPPQRLQPSPVRRRARRRGRLRQIEGDHA
jgi:sortase A